MAAKKRKSSGRKTSHQAAFGKAAKACKGSGKGFHACVRREMKK